MTRRRRKPQQSDSASETLNLIESRGDRIAEWIATNSTLLFSVAGGILAIAAAWGFASASREEAAEMSTAALAQVRAEYRAAMGASPGSIVVPELANQDEAAEIRSEFVAEYRKVAAEYSGEPAGAVAFLEAGTLQQALGDSTAALASYEEALQHLGPDQALRGFVLGRQGSVYEGLGDWKAAAVAYEAAAKIRAYPIRGYALVNAARALARSGETARAVDLVTEWGKESPDYKLPVHVTAVLDEFRAGRSEY